MTRLEHAAGIRWAAAQAQIAAITLEIRDDADHLRQRAAATALQGLAEGLREAARVKAPEAGEAHDRETS